MYPAAGSHSPVSPFIQFGYMPLAGGCCWDVEPFLRSRLADLSLDDELLLEDVEELRFFFDFFFDCFESLRMLSLELMLVILSERSFLMSTGLIVGIEAFLMSLLRRSNAWKPLDGPLVSSMEYFD